MRVHDRKARAAQTVEHRRAYTDAALESWAVECFEPRSKSPMAAVAESGAQREPATPQRFRPYTAQGTETRTRRPPPLPLQTLSTQSQRVDAALKAVAKTNPDAHRVVREWAKSKVDGRCADAVADALELKPRRYHELRAQGRDLVMHELYVGR